MPGHIIDLLLDCFNLCSVVNYNTYGFLIHTFAGLHHNHEQGFSFQGQRHYSRIFNKITGYNHGQGVIQQIMMSYIILTQSQVAAGISILCFAHNHVLTIFHGDLILGDKPDSPAHQYRMGRVGS